MPEADRRPIASRDTSWAKAVAARLAAAGVTPNQVSIGSMAAGLLAGLALAASGSAEGLPRLGLLLAGALFCQVRLLCNLFDGMIALEGGKGGPDGPFWNEAPDRVADLLILVGAGLGVGEPALGWAAGALAVSTAYVRELGRANGLPSDFSGPMAKPQRMAVVTGAAVLSGLESIWGGRGDVLSAALWIVAAGSAVTAVRRGARQIRALKARAAGR